MNYESHLMSISQLRIPNVANERVYICMDCSTESGIVLDQKRNVMKQKLFRYENSIRSTQNS